MDNETNIAAFVAAQPGSSSGATWTIGLDAFMLCAIFVLQIVLLLFLAKTISRDAALLHKWRAVVAAVLIGAVFFVANPTYQTQALIMPCLVTLLAGTLVCRRLFVIAVEKALMVSAIFVLLSVGMGDLYQRVADRLIPGRATVGQALSHAIDNHARERLHQPDLPPSDGVLEATLRAYTTTNVGGFAGKLIGVVQAGLESKAELDRVPELARTGTTSTNVATTAEAPALDFAARAASARAAIASRWLGALLDTVFIALVFALKMVLLWFLLRVLTHGTADVTRRKLAAVVLLLAAIYYVANPTLETHSALQAFIVVFLCGILVIKRAFWIAIEKAAYVSAVYGMLSIAIGDIYRSTAGAISPNRATLNTTLAAAVDASARSTPDELAQPPSDGITHALLQAVVSSDDDSAIGSALGFLKAGLEAKQYVEKLRHQAEMEAQIANLLAGGGTNTIRTAEDMAALKEEFGGTNAYKGNLGGTNSHEGLAGAYAHAKAQIEEANRVASNNAMIVNMLSGAGTNVGTRSEEMAKLHAALMDEARRGQLDLSGTPASDLAAALSAMPSAAPTGTASMLRAATTPSAETAEAQEAPRDLLAGMVLTSTGLLVPAPRPDEAVPEPTPATVVAVAPAATPPPAPAKPAPPPVLRPTMKLHVNAAMPRETQRLWLTAMKKVKVTGIIRSGNGAAALIGALVLDPGYVHSVDLDGATYNFRLQSVNEEGICIWEPQLAPAGEAEFSISL